MAKGDAGAAVGNTFSNKDGHMGPGYDIMGRKQDTVGGQPGYTPNFGGMQSLQPQSGFWGNMTNAVNNIAGLRKTMGGQPNPMQRGWGIGVGNPHQFGAGMMQSPERGIFPGEMNGPRVPPAISRMPFNPGTTPGTGINPPLGGHGQFPGGENPGIPDMSHREGSKYIDGMTGKVIGHYDNNNKLVYNPGMGLTMPAPGGDGNYWPGNLGSLMPMNPNPYGSDQWMNFENQHRAPGSLTTYSRGPNGQMFKAV